MTVADILHAPWAIMPGRLDEIQSIYEARLRGERPDWAAIEARAGRPMLNEREDYEIRDGAALIPLRGILGQRMNLMANMSGGTSTEMFARDVRTAAADPLAQSIVILADTPGGTVAGTQAAAAAVTAVRGVKPIATLVQGLMASAGVWVGSAADLVVLDSKTAQVGSIGVVATHRDVSGREAAEGIKTTEIVAGRFKRAASQYGPLSELGQIVLQDQVDYLYSLFVADVAQNRGVSEREVLERMADGRMFIGQQAIDAGLADQVSTLEELIVQLNQSSRNRSVFSAVTQSQSMDSAPHPKTPMQWAHEWAAENPDAAAVLRAEGGAAERDRIAAVRAQALQGHEALIEQLAADGQTTGPEAAVLVVAAQRQRSINQAAMRLAEAPSALALDPGPDAQLETMVAAPAPPEPTPQELAEKARNIVDAAKAGGKTMSVSQAVAQARRELFA